MTIFATSVTTIASWTCLMMDWHNAATGICIFRILFFKRFRS